MQIIKAFYPSDSEFKNFEVAISDWYCKPAILGSLATKLGCLFLTCSKYGCRQFEPSWFSSFPVQNIDTLVYKKNLKWIVIEFNIHAQPVPFSSERIINLYE